MSDRPIITAIDVGSNSIKMLAAKVTDAGFSVIPSYHTIPARLQAGLGPDMMLDEDALGRGEDAIAELAARARALGSVRICAFGTSALRDAVNSGVLIERVRKSCSIELRVISGEEEAKSSYLAVCPERRGVVVNPGGGSTEITIGSGSNIEKAVSVHTGAVALSKICSQDDPDGIIRIAYGHIENALHDPDIYRGLPVTLSGGAVSCASAVIKGITDIHAYDGDISFRLTEAEKLFYALCPMPLAQRLMLRGMVPSRADILPFGLAILIAFMRFAGAESASVTLHDNLYGFLRMMRDEMRLG